MHQGCFMKCAGWYETHRLVDTLVPTDRCEHHLAAWILPRAEISSCQSISLHNEQTDSECRVFLCWMFVLIASLACDESFRECTVPAGPIQKTAVLSSTTSSFKVSVSSERLTRSTAVLSPPLKAGGSTLKLRRDFLQRIPARGNGWPRTCQRIIDTWL